MGSQPCFAVILVQRNEGVEFRQVFMLKEMPSSAVQHSWPLDREKLVPDCVSVQVCVCVFFGSLKHSVAAALRTCPTAVTTGKPQLSLQSQLKGSEVE